jgi:hypothetical protein
MLQDNPQLGGWNSVVASIRNWIPAKPASEMSAMACRSSLPHVMVKSDSTPRRQRLYPEELL